MNVRENGRSGAAAAAAAALAAVAVAGGIAATAAATAAERRQQTPTLPNIVFILADDLGWTDLGCQGSRYYETPNIDRLAAEGMRWTSFCQYPNCAPTRAALLSGQYAPRTGIYTVDTLERGRAADRKMNVPVNETRLPLDRETIADALKRAGYATAMFGKWHLGNGPAYHPSRRGFDIAHATGGAAPHFTFQYRPPVASKPGAYLADVNTDLAVDFIEKHTSQNKDRPFFLYLPYNAVHSPHQAKPEMIARFRDKPPVGGHKDPTYAAMIASLDEGVGRILSTLERLKLQDNTIVVFASDNGGVGGYQEIAGTGITDNAPLRGGKGMFYEGGLRVPFFVRWPGVVKPGTVSDQAAAHVDVFPTFLAMAGVSERPKQKLDGLSLVPVLRDPAARLTRDALYFHFPGYLEGYKTPQWRTVPVGAIRAGDWKLMEFYEDGRLELYNLKDDPGEKKNLAAAQPDRAKALRAKLDTWRKETKAAMPTPKASKGSAP